MRENIYNSSSFFHLSQRHAEMEGLPVEVTLTEGLLMGAAISGQRLIWKNSSRAIPQVGKPSVTWLGTQGEHPLWFHRYCEPVIKHDEQACGLFADLLRRNSPIGERRKRRRHEKALGRWIPHDFDSSSSESIAFLRNPTGFIVKLGWKSTKQHVSSTAVFGRERMLILNGKADYHGLTGRNESAAQLRTAAVNLKGGLRVTVHGWCEQKSFRKLCRKNPDSGAELYGWLLPARAQYEIPPVEWTKFKQIGSILLPSIHLRYISPLDPYCPAPEVAEMLTHADTSWKMPSWCDCSAIRGLMGSEEQLAWQLAAQLRNLYDELAPGSELEAWLAEVAVLLSHWIRGQHANQLRMLYPGPDNNPVDAISCGIADQLQVNAKSVRELVRGFHKVSTAEVKEELERIEAEGWVEELDGGRWQLNFPDLPNLSAKLSETVPKA